jgi:hypothetical protein
MPFMPFWIRNEDKEGRRKDRQNLEEAFLTKPSL